MPPAPFRPHSTSRRAERTGHNILGSVGHPTFFDDPGKTRDEYGLLTNKKYGTAAATTNGQLSDVLQTNRHLVGKRLIAVSDELTVTRALRPRLRKQSVVGVPGEGILFCRFPSAHAGPRCRGSR